MSRLAKKSIILPKDVSFSLDNGNTVFHGPKGDVKVFVHEQVIITKEGDELRVSSKKSQKNMKALLGTTYSLLKNAVEGAEKGFEKKLEIDGIGYKAQVDGDTISLFLGLTHQIKIKIPKGISIKVEKNIITINGASKEIVGQFAAIIRSQKPPEPYKGKGIHYFGEIIRRKAGKKAVSTA